MRQRSSPHIQAGKRPRSSASSGCRMRGGRSTPPADLRPTRQWFLRETARALINNRRRYSAQVPNQGGCSPSSPNMPHRGVAEWQTRMPQEHVGIARAGSSPAAPTKRWARPSARTAFFMPKTPRTGRERRGHVQGERARRARPNQPCAGRGGQPGPRLQGAL